MGIFVNIFVHGKLIANMKLMLLELQMKIFLAIRS
jgi:hypothetical protein